MDMLFSAIFLVELVFKLMWNGFQHQYRGSSKYPNRFDTTLAIIDILQLIFIFVVRVGLADDG